MVRVSPTSIVADTVGLLEVGVTATSETMAVGSAVGSVVGCVVGVGVSEPEGTSVTSLPLAS